MFGRNKKVEEEERVEVKVAEPKCPSCHVQGLKFMTYSTKKEEYIHPFMAIHCTECGHVHGVVTRHVYTN